MKNHDYENLTPLDWFKYEFATIEYDYKLPEKISTTVYSMVQRLYEQTIIESRITGKDVRQEDYGATVPRHLVKCGNTVSMSDTMEEMHNRLIRGMVANGVTVIDLARAWASLDGKRDAFDAGATSADIEAGGGHFYGYISEVEEMLRRATKYAGERQ